MRYFPSRNEFSSLMTNNTFFHLVTIISFETTVVIGWRTLEIRRFSGIGANRSEEDF